MQRLIHIFQTLREYIILAFFLTLSIILLGSNNNRQMQSIRSYTVGFIGILQGVFTSVPNIFELQRENEVLRNMNVKLSDEVSRLRSARLENVRLREMLKLKEHSTFALIAADIVGKNLNLLRNTITINVGEENGIKPGMPIISSCGIVGRVTATSKHYSIGQLLISKDFRASAKIQRSRVDGIIVWNGGELVNLINVPKMQDVKIGDVVETSEYSHHFPPHILIGIVVDVTEKQGSLTKEIKVKPAVDFATLEQVFVIPITPDPERISLEQKIIGNQ